MAEDVRWLTYDEVARDLGITRESARQLAIRKRWARQRGNDGKARIGVPEEEFQARTSDSTPPAPSDDTPHQSSHTPSDDTGDDLSVPRVLERHIERLEGELQALKEERDGLRADVEAERLRAVQVEALQAVIEAERRRAEDLRTDRDELRADRNRWAGIAEAHQRQIAEMMAAKASRGWWPFRRRA